MIGSPPALILTSGVYISQVLGSYIHPSYNIFVYIVAPAHRSEDTLVWNIDKHNRDKDHPNLLAVFLLFLQIYQWSYWCLTYLWVSLRSY